MNATFTTHTGAQFTVRDDFDPPPPDAEPGTIYDANKRVWLSAVFPDLDHAYTAPLKKSEARAIASALMGAAAEL